MDNFEQSEKKPNAFLNYITENGDSIKKLFINHIGMMIFGLVVLITAKLMSSKLGSDWAFYAMGALTVLMYFSLIYTAMWERGAKDKIRLDGGRLKRNVFNGLYFYLIGNAVAIISGFICLLLSFLLTDEVSFVNNVYGVFRIISHYYSSMYLPYTRNLQEWNNLLRASSCCLIINLIRNCASLVEVGHRSLILALECKSLTIG
jgi:hypothetical protein